MLFLQQNGKKEREKKQKKQTFMLDSVGGNTAAWLDWQKSCVNVLSGKIESCIKMAVIGGGSRN